MPNRNRVISPVEQAGGAHPHPQSSGASSPPLPPAPGPLPPPVPPAPRPAANSAIASSLGYGGGGGPAATMLTFTPDQAARTSFPPGCRVLYSSPSADSSSIEPSRALMGVVESVSMDVSPRPDAAIRDLLYRVKFPGVADARLIPERSLRFAPRCPVTVTLPGHVPASASSSMEGNVMMTLEAEDGASTYSVRVRLPDGTEAVQHGVTSDCIRFRPAVAAAGGALAADAFRPARGHAPAAPVLAVRIPPREERPADVASTVSFEDNSGGGGAPPAGDMSSKRPRRASSPSDEPNAKRRRWSPPSRKDLSKNATPLACTFTCDLDEHRPDSEGPLKIYLPEWLNSSRVNGRSLIGFLVGRGGQKFKELEEKYRREGERCTLGIRGEGSGSVTDSDDALHVLVTSPSGRYDREYSRTVGRIKRDIETSAIEFLDGDDSLGRFLYDFASLNFHGRTNRERSCGNRYERDAGNAVYQRLHRNLKRLVWMEVVELPVDGNGQHHAKFLEQPVKLIRKDSKCHIDVFGASDEEMLCDPYAIVTSHDLGNVSAAVERLEVEIRAHQRKCRKKCRR